MTRVTALLSLVSVFTAFPVQASAQTDPTELTVVTVEGQQSVPTVNIDGDEMLFLDTVAALFQVTVVENSSAGTLTVDTGTQNIILTANQQLASVGGRLISLDSAPRRTDGRWLVPLDFLMNALAPVYGQTVEFRRQSRLILIGEVLVPRLSVSYVSRERSDELELEIAPSASYELTEADNRLILQFDVDAVEVGRIPDTTGGIIRDIQMSNVPPGLFIELGPAYASHSISHVAPSDDSATVSLTLESSSSNADTASAELPDAVSATEESAPVPPRADSPVLFDSRPAVRTVVVDAGHGGTDEGAEGPGGTLEKDITLSTARLLTTALERRLGVRVILTRARDTDVDLDRRAAIANNSTADLFISLHVNSSSSTIPTGAEIFYLSVDEYGSEAQAIVNREERRLPTVGGGTREIDIIPWELAQVYHLNQSAIFARFVEEELRRRVPLSPRAIQQAPFRVLAGANMPAVLLEMGFISNREQEQRLLSAGFQASIVEALVTSVVRFQEAIEQTNGSLSSRAVDSRDSPETVDTVSDGR